MSSIPQFDDHHTRCVWVQAQLKLKGKSFASVGRANGCSGTAVRQTLFIPSARLEKVLAEEMGTTPEELFPERYIDGRRRHAVRQNAHENVHHNVETAARA